MQSTTRRILGLLAASALALTAVAAEMTDEPLSKIKQEVDGGTAVIVDVREADEWAELHVDGAILLPSSTLEDGVSEAELELLPKDKTLYLHCVVGKRAMKAATLLEKGGYQVRAMSVGPDEMIAAGFPAAKGKRPSAR